MYDQPILYDFDGEISGFSYCQTSHDECDKEDDIREWNDLHFDNIKVVNESVLRISSMDFQSFKVRMP